MTIDEVMARLEEAGTEQNRTIYRRHGAKDPQFGVAFSVLRPLAKSIGRDHELARALWATGNTDARLLACMVADPKQTTDAELDAWLAEIDYYLLVDEFSRVAGLAPGVRARMERWTASARDWTSQAGWDLMGYLASTDASTDTSLDDAFFLAAIERIEREIDTAGNRTRHTMNGALIAIALRDDALREAAVAAAGRIGPVTVDHGETGCVTPGAIPYIEKSLAYREAQAAKRAAKSMASAGA